MTQNNDPLSNYRALDLTDEKGLFCGKILADLGADVIKIERPGGDRARDIGPFYHDIAHREKSLFWMAYNANKRSITLNLGTADGRYLFKRLAKTADFVIESFVPGHMTNLGLGFEELRDINPRIIVTSISPFGQTGPYKDYKAPDIVCMAMGGIMSLTGDPDRPPVRISCPQAHLLGAAEAAVGTLIAHYNREASGEGQYVDSSIQQSVVWTMLGARGFWDLNGVILRRSGVHRGGLSSSAVQRHTWKCKDGEVTFVIIGGSSGAHTNRSLVEWMDNEGMDVDFLKSIDWDMFDMATADQEFHDRVEKSISQFFETHTKSELFQWAVERSVLLCPVSSAKDLAESPQLAARSFWTDLDHPELGCAIRYPGSFVQGSRSLCRLRRRAPLIGEHNKEIYIGELGLSQDHLGMMKEAGII